MSPGKGKLNLFDVLALLYAVAFLAALIALLSGCRPAREYNPHQVKALKEVRNRVDRK